MADKLEEYKARARELGVEIMVIPSADWGGLVWVSEPARAARRGWTCANRHLDPDTGREFENAPGRDTCEICGRGR